MIKYKSIIFLFNLFFLQIQKYSPMMRVRACCTAVVWMNQSGPRHQSIDDGFHSCTTVVAKQMLKPNVPASNGRWPMMRTVLPAMEKQSADNTYALPPHGYSIAPAGAPPMPMMPQYDSQPIMPPSPSSGYGSAVCTTSTTIAASFKLWKIYNQTFSNNDQLII